MWDEDSETGKPSVTIMIVGLATGMSHILTHNLLHYSQLFRLLVGAFSGVESIQDD